MHAHCSCSSTLRTNCVRMLGKKMSVPGVCRLVVAATGKQSAQLHHASELQQQRHTAPKMRTNIRAPKTLEQTQETNENIVGEKISSNAHLRHCSHACRTSIIQSAHKHMRTAVSMHVFALPESRYGAHKNTHTYVNMRVPCSWIDYVTSMYGMSV